MDTTVTQAEPELTSSISATSDTVIRQSSRMTGVSTIDVALSAQR
jgi:hypothetical protein